MTEMETVTAAAELINYVQTGLMVRVADRADGDSQFYDLPIVGYAPTSCPATGSHAIYPVVVMPGSFGFSVLPLPHAIEALDRAHRGSDFEADQIYSARQGQVLS